ncbi:alpha/beta fold hydrolase, partial [Streptomyces sp. NPDC004830]
QLGLDAVFTYNDEYAMLLMRALQDEGVRIPERAAEPWFAEAFPAFEAWLDGSGDFDAVFVPFFHGRWDDTARAHAGREEAETNDEAADAYGGDGAYDPEATRGALARLAAPVLVLAGGADGGPAPGLARRTAGVFPHAECVVQPGAGHYPWLDDPEWFTGRVSAFFA